MKRMPPVSKDKGELTPPRKKMKEEADGGTSFEIPVADASISKVTTTEKAAAASQVRARNLEKTVLGVEVSRRPPPGRSGSGWRTRRAR